MFKLRILLIWAVVLAIVGFTVPMPAHAQAQPTITTTSAAMTAATNRMVVSSNTGFTASTGTQQYVAYVDNEAMLITAVSGTTLVNVQRGFGQSKQTAHVSGAHVLTGASGSVSAGNVTGGPFVQNTPVGSCTRAAIASLPVINIRTGEWANCLNGNWLLQTPLDNYPAGPLVGPCNIPIGSVAYASVGTNSADVANKRMTTSIFVPYTGFYTGIQVLQGGTATTDNITAGLYDSGGNPIVNAGATGVLLASANTFKSLPFTANATAVAQTTTLVTGPALYFIGVTGNGATAGAYQTVPTLTFKNILSQGTTSITFGTFPSFTVPTTFTADLAPVACLYN